MAKEDGKEYTGEPVDAEMDIGLASKDGKDIAIKVFDKSSLLALDAKATNKTLHVKHLLSPISSKEVGTIICIGLNYLHHAQEAGLDLPKAPITFIKPRLSLTGPYPSPIRVPQASQNDQLDFESELCVVIGKAARDVSEEDAYSYILGYCSSNDVSARALQMATSQWTHGKGLDTFCPIGPCIVSDVDPTKLHLRGLLNGKVMQDSPCNDLIFDIKKLVSYCSIGTTLEPGTIILTGTPAGVGFMRKPPVWMRDGDEISVEISGGLGTLVNKIEFE